MTNQAELTDLEAAELVDALVCVLPVAAKARSADYGLFFQLILLRDGPASVVKEIRDLYKLVQKIPALELFNHAYQNTFFLFKKGGLSFSCAMANLKRATGWCGANDK